MTKEKFIKLMKSKGYTYLNIIRLGAAGYPDSQFLKNGKSVFVEFKKDKDTVKPLQKFRIDELSKDNFTAFALHEDDGVVYPENYYINFEKL